eukprot:s632_g1.t1
MIGDGVREDHSSFWKTVIWMEQTAFGPKMMKMAQKDSWMLSKMLSDDAGFTWYIREGSKADQPEEEQGTEKEKKGIISDWTLGVMGVVLRELHRLPPDLAQRAVRDGLARPRPGRPEEFWVELALPFKPGPLNRAPPVLLNHMPRLDWQMWFVSLRWAGTGERPSWFQEFLQGLMERRPTVLKLVAHPWQHEAPVVERTAQHGARRWWHLNLTKSLGLLQTSGTVTRNTVLDPAILVIGLVSMVIALSAFMAFCTSSSSGKRKVTRYPAPAGKVPDFLPAEEMAQKGRCLSTALRARGKGESMRPSEVNNPPSSVSVPAASDTSLPPPQEPKHIGGEEGGMFNWSPRSAEDIETLCPCLVVPDGMEFVFAVREVLTVVRQESGMPRA